MNSEEARRKALSEIQESGLSYRDWYRDIYLHSEHWKILRGAAKSHYGNKCDKCGSKQRLDVHHLKYRDIYDVTLKDLQVLCRICHHNEHAVERGWDLKVKQPKPKKAKGKSKKKNRKKISIALGPEVLSKLSPHLIPEYDGQFAHVTHAQVLAVQPSYGSWSDIQMIAFGVGTKPRKGWMKKIRKNGLRLKMANWMIAVNDQNKPKVQPVYKEVTQSDVDLEHALSAALAMSDYSEITYN